MNKRHEDSIFRKVESGGIEIIPDNKGHFTTYKFNNQCKGNRTYIDFHYVARYAKDIEQCCKCALRKENDMFLCRFMDCSAEHRKDGKNVVLVEFKEIKGIVHDGKKLKGIKD